METQNESEQIALPPLRLTTSRIRALHDAASTRRTYREELMSIVGAIAGLTEGLKDPGGFSADQITRDSGLREAFSRTNDPDEKARIIRQAIAYYQLQVDELQKEFIRLYEFFSAPHQSAEKHRSRLKEALRAVGSFIHGGAQDTGGDVVTRKFEISCLRMDDQFVAKEPFNRLMTSTGYRPDLGKHDQVCRIVSMDAGDVFTVASIDLENGLVYFRCHNRYGKGGSGDSSCYVEADNFLKLIGVDERDL